MNTACEDFARGVDEDLRCERDAVRLDEDLHEHMHYCEGRVMYLPAQNPSRSPGLDPSLQGGITFTWVRCQVTRRTSIRPYIVRNPLR